MAPHPATRRRSKQSFAVIRDHTVFAAERGGVMTTTTGRTKMLRQGRTILVAALALVVIGAGTAMAKPGGAGPGATDDIDDLMLRVDTIEDDTPRGCIRLRCR